MRFFRGPGTPGSRSAPQSLQLLSSYRIGQRTVDYVLLADGSTRWVCNCDDYQSACNCPQGAWCKHVAKAAAIRSIERLTGERVVVRTLARPASAAPTHTDARTPTLEPQSLDIAAARLQ